MKNHLTYGKNISSKKYKENNFKNKNARKQKHLNKKMYRRLKKL